MTHHQEQDQRSLMLHTAAIKLMQQDALLIERALGILDRWMKSTVIHSAPLLKEWRRILTERDWDLALSKSERGNQLRQASPVACILPNKQRLEIIKSCMAPLRPPITDATFCPTCFWLTLSPQYLSQSRARQPPVIVRKPLS